MRGPAVTGRPERDRRARPLLRTVLGRVLRRTRLSQRRALADVARAARVSMPYLSELERGRKEASSEVLAAISLLSAPAGNPWTTINNGPPGRNQPK